LLAQKLGKPIVILQIMMKPTSRAFKKGVRLTAANVFLTLGGNHLSCKKYRYKIQGNLNSELITDKQVMMFVKRIL
jgi:hypothetical protein